MKTQFMFTMLLALAVSVFAVDEILAKIDPETVVGMWLFDEGEGQIVGDSTENGHDGTINGQAEWGDGKFADALSIGAGNTIYVPHSEDLNLKNFTIAAWLSTEVGGSYIGVICKAHNNPTRNYAIYIDQDTSAIALSIGNEAAASWSGAKGTTPVNDGEWHHVAITFDDDQNGGQIFTDGVAETQFTIVHDIPQPNADLVFASWSHGGGNAGYIGLLDEIAIFSVALEEADIKDIMQDGLSSILEPSPVEPGDKLAATWASIKVER